MSNSCRWREFIIWWADVYPRRKRGKYEDVDKLIQAVTDKIRDIQRGDKCDTPKD